MLVICRSVSLPYNDTRVRGGILDCRCARRSAGRQVGTKGWSFPMLLIDLNEPHHPHHDQLLNLTHTTATRERDGAA